MGSAFGPPDMMVCLLFIRLQAFLLGDVMEKVGLRQLEETGAQVSAIELVCGDRLVCWLYTDMLCLQLLFVLTIRL